MAHCEGLLISNVRCRACDAPQVSLLDWAAILTRPMAQLVGTASRPSAALRLRKESGLSQKSRQKSPPSATIYKYSSSTSPCKRVPVCQPRSPNR